MGGFPEEFTERYAVITYNEPGWYDVGLQVVNSQGSTYEVYEDFIHVLPSPQLPFIDRDYDTLIVQLNVGEQIEWRKDGALISEDTSLPLEQSGDYEIRIIAANGCVSSSNNFIDLMPKVDFAAHKETICEGSFVQFTDLTQGNIDSRLWYFEGGNPANSSEVTPLVTYENQGEYSVRLEVTNSAGTSVEEYESFVNVTENFNVTFQLDSTVVCAGEPIQITAEGATTYTWLNPFNILNDEIIVTPDEGSQYYIVVGQRENGCSSTDSLEVIGVAVPSIEIEVDRDTLCQGKEVTIISSGADSYSLNEALVSIDGVYQLSPSQTTLYEVQGFNEIGCSSSIVSHLVVVDQLPSVSVSLDAFDMCQGEELEGTFSGADEYFMLPVETVVGFEMDSFVISPTETTEYILFGMNDCGTDSVIFVITVHSNPPLPEIEEIDSLLFVVNESNYELIQWFKEDVLMIEGASLITYEEGEYKVVVTDFNGCQNSTTFLKGSASVVVNEDNITDLVKVYPIPTFDKLTIDYHGFEFKHASAYMVDFKGSVVLTRKIEANKDNHQFVVDVSSLHEGVYVLFIEGEDFSLSKKIVIQKSDK